MIDDAWSSAEAVGGSAAHAHKLPECAFYAVFDGHGGVRAAKIASRELWRNMHDSLLAELRPALAVQAAVSGGGQTTVADRNALDEETLHRVISTAFYKTEEDVLTHARRQRWEDGCTAVCTLVLGRTLAVGNLGDSRAVLCSGGQAVRLSRDHKPSDKRERARILAAGGSVRVIAGIHRLNGELSLSRAFGDASHKARFQLPVRAQASPARRSSSALRVSGLASPLSKTATAATEMAHGQTGRACSPMRAVGQDASGFAPSATAGAPVAVGGGVATTLATATPSPATPAAAKPVSSAVSSAVPLAVSSDGLSSASAPPVFPEQALSSEPEVSFRQLTAADRFLLLACDGVWDVLSDDEAVKVVSDALDGVPLAPTTQPGRNTSPMRGARGVYGPPAPGGELQKAAERLVHVVLTSGRCTDNVSAVICLLPGYDASAAIPAAIPAKQEEQHAVSPCIP